MIAFLLGGFLFTLVFKVFGWASVSWWVVFLPVWVPVTLFIFLGVATIILSLIAKLILPEHDYSTKFSDPAHPK